MAPNHLSILGIIHTAISILAILAAVYALIRDGKISPVSRPGKIYILLTIITCLTAFPIMKTGHPTAGHFVGILVLLLLPIGIYATSFRFLGKLAEYVQIVTMSTTVFFSMIPAIVETLTRLPISHPLAADPASPIISTGLLILVTLYIGGTLYQLVVLFKKRKKSLQDPKNTINLTE